MNSSEISAIRLANQCLNGNKFNAAEDAITYLTAVQSQDYLGAKWAISQRTGILTNSELDKLYNEGRFLRTHVMRPTWHFVMPEDILWMQKLTSSRVQKINAYYYKRRELDEKVLKKCNELISEALKNNNYKTREEISEFLLQAANIEAKGERLGAILMNAELEGLICSGPLKGKQFSYALIEERAMNQRILSNDEALFELTKRYFTSHGPALIKDFAWWSGLTISEIKQGLELTKNILNSEQIKGQTYYFGEIIKAEPEEPGTIHLLPNYDELLIAYKDHSVSSDIIKAKNNIDLMRILGNHIVIMDGQVIGGWKRIPKSKNFEIQTSLLINLTKQQQQNLETEVEKFAKFIEKGVILN